MGARERKRKGGNRSRRREDATLLAYLKMALRMAARATS